MSKALQAAVAAAARARSGRAHVSRVGGGCDVVLSPAEDGGYALIGVRRVSWRLFDGIAWGESGVYAQMAERLRALGYRWRALCKVWDVDRPADLERLRSLRLASVKPPSFRR